VVGDVTLGALLFQSLQVDTHTHAAYGRRWVRRNTRILVGATTD
jgi:hypothetical protein